MMLYYISGNNMKELKYRSLYLSLKADIETGRIESGARLPGVRELAAQNSSSPNTVLKALSALEQEGLIEKTQGRGIFVKAAAEAAAVETSVVLINCGRTDPFHMRLVSEVETALQQRGCSIRIGRSFTESVAGDAAMIKIGDRLTAEDYDSYDVPVLNIGRFVPGADFPGNYIVADLYGGYFDICSALIDAGRERIAYVGGDGTADDPGQLAVLDRLAGSSKGFRQECGIDAGGWSADAGYRAMQDLLLAGDFPDAVICASDELAAGVFRAGREAGLAVPGDLMISGSGDDSIADLLEIPLTSLRFQYRVMASAAADYVVGLSAGRLDENDRIRMRLDPQLIIRDSALNEKAPPLSTEEGADELFWL